MHASKEHAAVAARALEIVQTALTNDQIAALDGQLQTLSDFIDAAWRRLPREETWTRDRSRRRDRAATERRAKAGRPDGTAP